MEYGILSLLPVCVALVLAFVTKDALLSILIGVLTGIIVSVSVRQENHWGLN